MKNLDETHEFLLQARPFVNDLNQKLNYMYNTPQKVIYLKKVVIKLEKEIERKNKF